MRGWTRQWIIRPEGTGPANPVSDHAGGVATVKQADLVQRLLVQRGLADADASAGAASMEFRRLSVRLLTSSALICPYCPCCVAMMYLPIS